LVKRKVHGILKPAGGKKVLGHSTASGNRYIVVTATRTFPQEGRNGDGGGRKLSVEVKSQRAKREHHSVPNGKKGQVVLL
jgi:hypothetical protein